jgi:23S rRNA pseudouridine955/2504/2580 synthase
MIVNKPPGINVHPGDHKTKEVSLIELIQDYLGERYNSLSFRPALVHRIDRDTSGCIMIAKDKKTLEALLVLLQSGHIEKVYHTIVLGTPDKPRDTIDARLLRIEDAHGEAKVRVDER